MKKTVLIILTIFIIIISTLFMWLKNKQSATRETYKINEQYEQYLNKEVYGTDIATLINKTIESNEKNSVQKDEKNYYIDNEKNSIKIYLNMITIEKTYPMEAIYNNGITNFVQNFNLILFKCTNIEYHKNTGQVKSITFEQLEK